MYTHRSTREKWLLMIEESFCVYKSMTLQFAQSFWWSWIWPASQGAKNGRKTFANAKSDLSRKKPRENETEKERTNDAILCLEMLKVQYDSGKVVIIHNRICAVSMRVSNIHSRREKSAQLKPLPCDELATKHKLLSLSIFWLPLLPLRNIANPRKNIEWQREETNYKTTIQKPFSQTKLRSFPLFFRIRSVRRHGTYFTTHKSFALWPDNEKYAATDTERKRERHGTATK